MSKFVIPEQVRLMDTHIEDTKHGVKHKGYNIKISPGNNSFTAHMGDGTGIIELYAVNNSLLTDSCSPCSKLDRESELAIFYVNGIPVDTVSLPSNFGDVDLGSPMAFGVAYSDLVSFLPQHYLDGDIDNIQIWNTALTESEIQQYMSCPPIGNETGLIGYWNFEEVVKPLR